jgi:hypothetical protein
MYLLLIIILVAFAVLLFPKRNKNKLDVYKMQAHAYSGLSPSVYAQFVNNLELAEQTTYSVTLSSRYLYKALDALQELALYTTTGSAETVPDVYVIVKAIGNEVESIIAENAARQGVRFVPRFLQDIRQEEQPVLKIATPSSGPWSQSADSGLWSESRERGWVAVTSNKATIENPPVPRDKSENQWVSEDDGDFMIDSETAPNFVKTVSSGPWSHQYPEGDFVSEQPTWHQFVPTPFIKSAHWITNVLLPKPA